MCIVVMSLLDFTTVTSTTYILIHILFYNHPIFKHFQVVKKSFKKIIIMAHLKNELGVEFDPFQNYVDISIEKLDEKWRIVALEVIGETKENREIGIKMLKVHMFAVVPYNNKMS